MEAERIWLQCEETSADVSCEGRTWSGHRIDDGCTEYVRADLYATLRADLDKACGLLRDARSMIDGMDYADETLAIDEFLAKGGDDG